MSDSPVQIGRDYYDSLSSLTINSRPIIESLTTLAQENTEAAPEIAKAVEKRINKAIPSHKLYAFYLLDSICKNVGVPYPSLFGSHIFKIFTQAYSLVDDPTRVKLIKLFKTWKTPSTATGLLLFDEDQVDLIDKFLIKATAANRPPEQQRQIEMSNVKATKPDLLREIDELTNLVNSRLLQMPDDRKGHERFELLQQLRTIISQPARIPQQQLDFTKKQLQSIREDEMMKLETFKQQQQQRQRPEFSTNQLQGLLNAPGQQPQFNGQTQALFSMMSKFLSQQQQQQHQQQQQRQQPPVHNNVARTNAGISSGNSNSSNRTLGVKNLEFLQGILRKSKSGQKVSAERKEAAEKKKSSEPDEIVISRFKLDQGFISKHKPSEAAIALIYTSKPNQCSNCSKRFAGTSEGARAKALHLDWHFRTNKKLKALSKQIHNRSWFLPDKQWEQFHEDEIVGGNEEGYEVGVQLNNKVSRKPKMTEEDMNKHVVAIPEDSENEITCGICRDKLVGVFDDTTGEWIWKNAIKKRGRIYHYSCWLETKGEDRDESPERH